MRVALTVSAFVIAFSAGCAERRAITTWDDATPADSLPDRAHKSVPSTADQNRVARLTTEDTFGGGRSTTTITPAGILIDRAIVDFRSRRSAITKKPRAHPAHSDTWVDVLAAIDDACSIAPTADDLGAFVRARVTLEVEHQTDLEKRRVLPPDIDERVNHTLGSIDARVAELKLILPDGGGFSPPKRLRDGVLVLQAPVSTPLISSPFGVRTDPLHGHARFHAGIDYAAPQGSMVYASADGVVVYAGWQGGYGRHIVIDHGDGVRTHYSHLEEIFTSAGQRVTLGDTVGAVGATGRATGPHLHFAVTNREGEFLDPGHVLHNANAFASDDGKPKSVATVVTTRDKKAQSVSGRASR